MSDKVGGMFGGSFTLHRLKPMGDPIQKQQENLLNLHQKGDASACLYDDNKDATINNINQDLKVKTLEVILLKERLEASEETKPDFVSNKN